MYAITLVVHSYVRWLVVLAALFAFARAAQALQARRAAPDALDRRAGLLLVIAVDTQLLIGALLYLVSPLTQLARQAFGAAMHDRVLRFWAVEHVAIGLMIVGCVHVGRVASRRATGVAVHRRAAVWYGLALALILFEALWPTLRFARPFVRV